MIFHLLFAFVFSFLAWNPFMKASPSKSQQKYSPKTSIAQNLPPSISENNGINVLTCKDHKVYSVGISSGGLAETRMAMMDPKRHITATTIDPKGAEFAKKVIEEEGFSSQIDVKMENVAKPLHYPDGYFDFVYARLVLHYLSKQELLQALNELHRILKEDGKFFVVVRGADCIETQDKNSVFDSYTGMTTYTLNGGSSRRHFHSEESIQNYLLSSGFNIEYAKTYKEQLYVDFQRTQLSSQIDTLIEVLTIK